MDSKPAIKTMMIDVESGKVLVSDETPIPENTDPQKMGATITYFRRYALQSLLCLEAEDDDGNTASGKTAPVAPARPATPAPAAPRPTAPAQNPVVAPAPAQTGEPKWKKWEQGGSPRQKVEGQQCPECGGTYVKGKTGSIYCNNRCWLAENSHLKTAYQMQATEVPAEYDPFPADLEDRVDQIPF